MSGFNWFDYLLLAILAFAIVSSLRKGFVREIISLGALIVGLFCALWFYGVAALYLKPYVSHPNIANFLGFLIVLGLVVLAGGILGWVFAKLLKLSGLTWLDRLAGALFGVLKGALLGAILILAVSAFAPGRPPQVVAGSRLSPYLIGTAGALCSLAPREVREGFRESYQKVRQIWAQTVERAPLPVPGREL